MTTPILLLDEWEESQTQPQATVNKALRWLECFTQLSVISASTASPPVSPADGDRYIVPSGASGDWAGHETEVALYISTAWEFRTAPFGSVAYIQDTSSRAQFANGSPVGWIPYP